MSKRTLVLSTLATALAVYILGGWLFTKSYEQQKLMASNTKASIQTKEPKENDTFAQALLVRPYSPIMGLADAPVTIVEFFDPACEACRAFYPILKSILDEFPDDVRIVLRYTPFHGEGSELAILVMEAARKQNVFIPVKEALLDNQDVWASHGAPDTNRILAIAAGAGLDVEAAANQIKSPSIVGILNQDRTDVKTIGIQQTPTFFVNGKPLVKFGVNELITQVRTEVENARKNKK